MRRNVLAALLAIQFVCLGCRADEDSRPLPAPVLEVEPATRVRFPETPLGGRTERVLSLRNLGAVPVSVALRTGTDVFAAPPDLRLLAGEARTIRVDFNPHSLGLHVGSLRLEWDGGSHEVAVEGRAIPACTPAPCAPAEVDPSSGACVAHAVVDGTACSSECLQGASCLAGRCVGAPLGCDDGNACTVDACMLGVGCSSAPADCGPVSPCEVAVCDPQLGCQRVTVEDGTPCGRQDCDGAEVCMSGTCVARVLPEGAACGDPSPCQPRGTCRGKTCERPPPTELNPVWTWSVPDAWQESITRPLLDAHGALHFTWRSGGHESLASISRAGSLRHSVAVTGDADEWALMESGLIIWQWGRWIFAHASTTGARAWTVDLNEVYGASGAASEDPDAWFGHYGPLASPRVGEVSVALSAPTVDGGVVPCLPMRRLTLSAEDGRVLESSPVSEHCWTSPQISDGLGRVVVGPKWPVSPVGILEPGRAPRWFPEETAYHWPQAWSGDLLLLLRPGGCAGVSGWSAQAGTFRFASVVHSHHGAVILPGEGVFVAGVVDCRIRLVFLVRLDPSDGRVLWMREIGNANNLVDMRAKLLATDRNSILAAAVRVEDPFATRLWFREITTAGRERWACPLPLDLYSHKLVGLHEGRIYTSNLRGIAAFDVPGIGLAPHGWVSEHGDLQRRRRPR